MRSRLNQIMSQHTGQEIDVIAKDTDRDNFMNADEAVNYGLIDSVLDKRILPSSEG